MAKSLLVFIALATIVPFVLGNIYRDIRNTKLMQDLDSGGPLYGIGLHGNDHLSDLVGYIGDEEDRDVQIEILKDAKLAGGLGVLGQGCNKCGGHCTGACGNPLSHLPRF